MDACNVYLCVCVCFLDSGDSHRISKHLEIPRVSCAE